MEIYFINTDATSNDGKSFHDAWITRDIAVGSGEAKYRNSLKRFGPSDVVALYVNDSGLVAIGVPADNNIVDVVEREKLVSPSESKEYHRRVNWCIDLRDTPISIDEMRSLGTPPTPHFVRCVDKGKALIAAKFARVLIESTARREGCDQLFLALKRIEETERGEMEVPQFSIGIAYSREEEIHRRFGGNQKSRISVAVQARAIFLFTSKGNEPGFVDGYSMDEMGRKIFSYVGDQQASDMKLTNGNSAVLTHAVTASALYLFETLGEGERFLGEFIYGNHRFEQRTGKNGNTRSLVIFDLVPVDQLPFLELNMADDGAFDVAQPKSLAEARAIAIAATAPTQGRSGQSVTRNLYVRSKAVKDYVLLRAQGICESCKKPSPFQRLDGTPYLEPHHTTRLSDGGPDHPRYVGAVCPDCHREIHYGMYGAAKNSALQRQLFEAEAD